MFRITIEAPSLKELMRKLAEVGDFESQVTSVYDTAAEDRDLHEIYDDAPVANQVAPEVNVTKEQAEESASLAARVESFKKPATEKVREPDLTGNVDSRGLPYDDRIHSATKAVNKDGSWRLRRGVSEELVKQVEAELQGIQKAHKYDLPAIPGIPKAAAPVDQPAPHTPGEEVAQYQDIPQVTVVKPAHDLKSFTENFFPTMMTLLQSGMIDQKYIDQIKQHFEIKELWDLIHSPEDMKEIFEELCNLGFITKVG